MAELQGSLHRDKDVRGVFNEFEMAGTVTFTIVFALATIMFLIFYPHISLLFFGLSFITLTAFGGLKFIIFDFEKSTVGGLFGTGDLNLINRTVDINPDSNEIKIKGKDSDDTFTVNKDKFSDDVWRQLIYNFKRINDPT